MGRCLTSKKLRAALWIAAKGKCQQCGCDLDPKKWHADHKDPYCVTGRTNVHEMQALCPNCNLKKGATMQEFYYRLDDYPGARKGVLSGLIKYKLWIMGRSADDVYWSIVLPTRYGKSDFIRTAAIIGQAEKLTGPGLVVTPAITLSSQMLEEKRLSAWRKRWEIHYRRRLVILSDIGVDPMPTEWLGSAHIQALVHKTDLVRHLADALLHRYHLPPVMFLDETHRYTKDNRWGDVPRAWESGGGLVVVSTATPFRHDKDDLIGFRMEEEGSKDFNRVFFTPHPDPEKLWKHSQIGERFVYKIIANHEVSYAQAWTEKAISRATVDWIDVDMKEVGGADLPDKDKKLSEIPKEDLPRCLSTVCRDPKVIHEFCQRVLKQLRHFRSHDNTADATFLVYGLNDSDGFKDNAHLVAIRQEFSRADPSLKTAIATMRSDEFATKDDEKSAHTISVFTDPDKKTLDGLFLKTMGSEGLDNDRIRVVGTLDNVRSAVAKIQQWNRGANIWGSCRHFVIVSLMDKCSVEIHETFIASQGGKATQEDIIESHKEEVPKPPPDPGPLFTVVQPTQAGAIDTDGLCCTPFEYAIACRLLEECSELIHSKTIPEIAAKARRLGIQPYATEEVQEPAGETSSEIALIVGQLNELVKYGARLLFRIAHGRFPDYSVKADLSEFGGTFKPKFINMVKDAAGVSGTWDQSNPDRIRDPDVMRRLRSIAEQLIGRLTSEIS